MQIKRKIGRRTITVELTDDELFLAYQEQQRLFDVENIQQELENQEDVDLVARYGLTWSELEPLKEKMAADLRRNLNKEMSWDYALSEAIRSVVEHYKAALQ